MEAEEIALAEAISCSARTELKKMMMMMMGFPAGVDKATPNEAK